MARHALIMAGGAGTRLWPLSRRSRPKQLLPLFDGRSLLELSRERLNGVVDRQHIWVITSAAYIDQVAAALPDVPRDNLIGEPLGRDTTNAIGLGCRLIAQRDPDATVGVFTADHVIEPVDVFARVINAGLTAAEQHAGSLVTFGVTPTEPHIGYGYIRRGAAVGDGVWRVAQFKEKPARSVAEQYLASGEYLWNSGMFAWRASAILEAIATHLPASDRLLAELASTWATRSAEERFDEFRALTAIPIDIGVLEKSDRVLVVELPCTWRDVGSWNALAATHPADTAGNVVLGERAVISEGRGNVIVCEGRHLIATLGVEDLVIVHCGDATLIARRDRADELKALVARCRELYGSAYE